MSQDLTLTPSVPAGAELTFSLYWYTSRVVKKVASAQVFRFDLSPTYAAGGRGRRAGRRRHDDRPGLGVGVSSAGRVLTVHTAQPGEPPARADWTLGPAAAAELRRRIGRSKGWRKSQDSISRSGVTTSLVSTLLITTSRRSRVSISCVICAPIRSRSSVSRAKSCVV